MGLSIYNPNTLSQIQQNMVSRGEIQKNMGVQGADEKIILQKKVDVDRLEHRPWMKNINKREQN